MKKEILRALNALVCFILVIQLAGCGTLIYPERKGQKSGRIDAGIAVLDGVGLLFFLIPGIIAYAVDFSNGTIYLPGTQRSSLDIKDIKQVKFDPKNYTYSTIEKIIKEETGYTVSLSGENTKITRLKSIDEMLLRFAQVLPDLKNKRVALSLR